MHSDPHEQVASKDQEGRKDFKKKREQAEIVSGSRHRKKRVVEDEDAFDEELSSEEFEGRASSSKQKRPSSTTDHSTQNSSGQKGKGQHFLDQKLTQHLSGIDQTAKSNPMLMKMIAKIAKSQKM